MVNTKDIVLDILHRVSSAIEASPTGWTPAVAQAVEKEIRADWGGDRVFIARRTGEGHSSRNSRIMRDYLTGERLSLLSRRYQISERQVLRIIKAPTK